MRPRGSATVSSEISGFVQRSNVFRKDVYSPSKNTKQVSVHCLRIAVGVLRTSNARTSGFSESLSRQIRCTHEYVFEGFFWCGFSYLTDIWLGVRPGPATRHVSSGIINPKTWILLFSHTVSANFRTWCLLLRAFLRRADSAHTTSVPCSFRSW